MEVNVFCGVLIFSNEIVAIKDTKANFDITFYPICIYL